MNRIIKLIVITIFIFDGCCAQKKTKPGPIITYRNPVIAGDFADPSVIRVGDTYYAAGTSSEWAPPYPVYVSKDLINWDYIGTVFNELPEWTIGSFWAPELFYHNETFFVYYSARRKSDRRNYIGVATTKDIRKGFTDHGCLLEWTNEAIDPFVIEDNGRLYITWKAYGLDSGKGVEILGSELAPDGLKLIGKAFTMLKAERENWENGGTEGEALFKHGPYFYMIYSGNDCCGPGCNYQVGIARAEKLQGPWEKFPGNPILVGDETWKCPGHGTVVTTPDGRYFYLHHAYNAVDFVYTARQGVLSEIIWDETTQWPAFRYGTTVPSQAESPFGTMQIKVQALVADFGKEISGVSWVWDARLPKPEFIIRNGSLQLTNNNSGLIGSFLGIVVKKGNYTFSTEVVIQDQILQSICLYGDSSNALGFGVRRGLLELWQIKNGKREVINTVELPEDLTEIGLQLQSHFGRFYTCSWVTKGSKPVAINTNLLDGSFLPRWDRAPRAGIIVSGDKTTPGMFRSIKMEYN
jgi:beta-xylosidase